MSADSNALQVAPSAISFGLLNIGVGAFYAVLSLCVIIGGPWEGAGREAMGSTGLLASFVWFACIAIHLQLIAAGIGLFRGEAWGRTLSVGYAGVSLIINGSWFMLCLLAGTTSSPLPAVALIYSIVLGSACLSSERAHRSDLTAAPVCGPG